MTLTGTIVTDNLDTLLVPLTKLEISYNLRDDGLDKIVRINKALDDVITIIAAFQLIKLNHIGNRVELKDVTVFHMIA